MKYIFFIIILLFGSGNLVSAGQAKYKILVDKVFSKRADRKIPAGDFAKIKAMGFNTVSPRWSSLNNLEYDLKQCRKNQLLLVPWTRATMVNITDAANSFTLRSGKRSKYISPNCDEYWEYLEKLLLKYAELESPSIGVFLDFEHYARPRLVEIFPYSFDQRVLKLYGKNPHGDIKAFYKFQRELWHRKTSIIAKKIIKLKPDFKLFIYPGVSTPFLSEFGRAMSENGIEVFCAGADTYGRNTFETLSGAAYSVKTTIRHAEEIAQKAVPRSKYLAGLDPIERGNSPELFELKMKAAAGECSGYWIFFEGFDFDDPRLPDYFTAFKRANNAIDKKNFDLKAKPETSAAAIPKFRKSGAKKIFVSGEMRRAFSKFYNKFNNYEALNMTGAGIDSIKYFDLLVLQKLSLASPDKNLIYTALRNYVAAGGALLLNYSCVETLPGLFPEIAQNGSGKSTMTHEVIKLRVNAPKRTVVNHAVLNLPTKMKKYNALYRYSFPIKATGKQGTVITENYRKQPVIIIGKFGKGRVVFSGDCFARRKEPSGTERQIIVALTRWLLGEE